MVQPLKKVKVVHKHKGKFRRHQSDTNVCVKVSTGLARRWHRPVLRVRHSRRRGATPAHICGSTLRR